MPTQIDLCWTALGWQKHEMAGGGGGEGTSLLPAQLFSVHQLFFTSIPHEDAHVNSQ